MICFMRVIIINPVRYFMMVHTDTVRTVSRSSKYFYEGGLSKSSNMFYEDSLY